ncbi:MAG: ribosome hibernation-promoting factor, HPF/YfiA family [Anaerolineales bacterium]
MTVRVDIHVQNFEPSERLRQHVSKKVSKLDRHLDLLETARVELRYVKSARSAKDRHVAQMTVSGKGIQVRAEERSKDMLASVDAVVDKIYRQIERYKGRRWSVRGDGRSASEVAPDLPAEESEGSSAAPIARRKKLGLIAMDEREAIEQMALLGHEDFFVFLDAATHQVHVLYRRREGGLGLIETEID